MMSCRQFFCEDIPAIRKLHMQLLIQDHVHQQFWDIDSMKTFTHAAKPALQTAGPQGKLHTSHACQQSAAPETTKSGDNLEL